MGREAHGHQLVTQFVCKHRGFMRGDSHLPVESQRRCACSSPAASNPGSKCIEIRKYMLHKSQSTYYCIPEDSWEGLVAAHEPK